MEWLDRLRGRRGVRDEAEHRDRGRVEYLMSEGFARQEAVQETPDALFDAVMAREAALGPGEESAAFWYPVVYGEAWSREALAERVKRRMGDG